MNEATMKPLYQSRTLNELLREHSKNLSDKICVTVSNDQRETHFTYKTLLEKATQAGHWISQHTALGDRVLLAMPTSPEFIEYFFGCILTGRIAVPLPVEKATSRFSRIKSVVADCSPELAIFRTPEDLEKMKSGLTNIEALVVQELASSHSARLHQQPFEAKANQIAFIQYTSGSTSDPKGVVLTHENILANLRMIQQGMQITENERVVSWLPLHHDMGLIGNLLSFIGAGASTFLYPYQEFSRNPLSWLEELSKHKATLSGAPTFAFDLIAKRLQKEPAPGQLTSYDLQSIRLLYCGSERISKVTIENFYKSLQSSRLSPETFFPCYGLAEASLYVSGYFQNANRINEFSIKDKHYPVCGKLANGLEVRICDENGGAMNPGEIGEIQIQGASISAGYWRDLSTQIKQGLYIGTKGEFLKTGDLGTMSNGEITITGRKKDLIKIRGRNIFPEDIEFEIEKLETWMPANSAVAFSGEKNRDTVGHETLIIVIEIARNRREGPFDDLVTQIQFVLSEYELRADQIVIVSPASLPKTSSGKKQRSRTATLLNENLLKEIWNSASETNSLPSDNHTSTIRVEKTLKSAQMQIIPAPLKAQPRPASSTNSKDLKKYFKALNEINKTTNFTLADERRTFPSDLITKLHRAGFFGLLIPESFGGEGLCHSDFAKIGAALGEADLSLGGLVGNHNTIGVLPILNSTTLPDKENVLTDMAKNGVIAAFALTEPGAGSNPRAISSQVRTENGALVLTGEKIWIGNAQYAGYITVLAQEISATGDELGISAFLLRRDLHSYTVSEEQLTLGLKAMPQNRLQFANVILREQDRLTPVGQGLKLAFDVMEYARFGLAALATGAMKSAYEKTVLFASERKIWTGRLSENLYFKQKMTDINLQTSILEGLVKFASQCLDEKSELPIVASLTCKILAGEWSFSAIDACLQFAGGRGYTETFGVSRIWRDARVIRVFEGPTETVAFQLGSMARRNPNLLNDFATQMLPTPKFIDLVSQIQNHLTHCESTYRSKVGFDSYALQIGIYAAKAIGHAIAFSTLEENADHLPLAADQQKEILELLALELEQNLRRSILLNEINLTNFQKNFKFNTTSAAMYDTWAGSTLFTLNSNVSRQQEDPTHNLHQETAELAVTLAPPLSHDLTSNSETEQKLIAWMKTHTRVNKIDCTKSIAQYGVDSLLAYELICFVEEEFHVTIAESVIAKKPSVHELCALILAPKVEKTTQKEKSKTETAPVRNVG